MGALKSRLTEVQEERGIEILLETFRRKKPIIFLGSSIYQSLGFSQKIEIRVQEENPSWDFVRMLVSPPQPTFSAR